MWISKRLLSTWTFTLCRSTLVRMDVGFVKRRVFKSTEKKYISISYTYLLITVPGIGLEQEQKPTKSSLVRGPCWLTFTLVFKGNPVRLDRQASLPVLTLPWDLLSLFQQNLRMFLAGKQFLTFKTSHSWARLQLMTTESQHPETSPGTVPACAGQ